MSLSKSTAACQKIKKEFDDAMTTPLDGWNILDQVPDESPQMCSTLARSLANDSNFRLHDESSMEHGTLGEQFDQLMKQQHLLVFGGIDKLQEMNDEVRKKCEEWLLDLSDKEVKANKVREGIEALQADNRAVLASIASTSATVSDGHCPISSSNQVPPELPSNVSSSPPDTVQSPNVSNINHEILNDRCDLNEQQLNNKDTSTRVDDVTSSIEKDSEKSGTDLEGQVLEHNANYSNDQSVAHSYDLFAPSTSTGRPSNRISLSSSPSQTVHTPNVSHINQERLDDRVDIEMDDPSTNADSDDHNNVNAERYKMIQHNPGKGGLLSNPSGDNQSAANEIEMIDDGGANLRSNEHASSTTNYSNEQTVTQSFDLFSPSISTGLGSNRTVLKRQATATTGQNGTKLNQLQLDRSVKRSKKSINNYNGYDGEKKEDGGDEEDSPNYVRYKEKIKVLQLNCTESECNVKLTSLPHLYDHLRTAHSLCPYRCFAMNCNSRFDNQHQIASHAKLHHPQSTIQFLCLVCQKEFDSQTKTYKHWNYMHLSGQFKCKFAHDCAQVTDTRHEMMNHQKAKHYSQMKHFQCTHDGCSASFAILFHLQRHELIHMNSRQFHCSYPQCSHSANQLANLIKHIRTQHFGLPPTVKEQNEKNVVDDRDPNEYVVEEVIAEKNELF